MARWNFFSRLADGIRNLLNIGQETRRDAPVPEASLPPEPPPPEPTIPFMPPPAPPEPTRAPSPSDIFPDIFGTGNKRQGPDMTSDDGFISDDDGRSGYLQEAVDEFLDKAGIDRDPDSGIVDADIDITIMIEATFTNPSPPGADIDRTVYAQLSGDDAREFLSNPSYAAPISVWAESPNPQDRTYNATIAAALSSADWLSRLGTVHDISIFE